VFGAKELDPPDASASEKAWFLFYGVASTIYRIIVTVYIALFIAGRFFFVGVILAIWALAAMAVVPLFKGMRHLAGSPRLRRHRPRAVAISVGAVSFVVALLLFVPMPSHTHAEGIVWLPDEAFVRAGANCFFDEFVAQPGTSVAKGDPLLKCDNP